MIPDFPMPPGLYGSIDVDDSGADGSLQTKSRIFHTFEKFVLPEETEDYGKHFCRVTKDKKQI